MAGDSETNVKITGNASSFRAAAEEAARIQGVLREKLIDLKSEHVKSGRVAKFYAAEISDLVPASDAAREAIQSLVKVVLAEGAFGAAIAGVGLVVASFHALSEATSASKEEFKKLEEAAEDYSKKTRQHVIDVIAALHGETEAQRQDRKETVPFLVQKIGLVDKLHAAEKRLKDIEANTDDNGGVADIVGLVRAQTEVDRLKARLKALQEQLDSSNEGSGDLSKDAAKRAAKEKAIIREVEQAQYRADQATTDNSINLAALKANQEIAELKLTAQEKEALIKEVADAQARADAASEESGRNLITIQVQQEQDARALTQALAEEAKEAKEIGKAALEMGRAAGQAFLGMLDGTKSVGDALVELIGKMIEAALRMAALRELASGDFIGAGLLEAGSVVAGGLGSITGGGGGHSGNLTVNMHNSFHGNALDVANSQQFQTAVISTIRTAQRRGRL